MEARTNLDFILDKANVNDLRSVVINKYPVNRLTVSSDHILSVALAVDEEIARLSSVAVGSKELLELYRIRYECAERIKQHLILNSEISNNPFGLAARAYIFFHASAHDVKVLAEASIFPISMTEAAQQNAGLVGKGMYDMIVYYFSEYIRSENPDSRVNNMREHGQVAAQNREKIREKYQLGGQQPVDLTFTIFDGEGVELDAELNAELNHVVEPVPTSAQGIGVDHLVDEGRSSPDRIEVLGADNINLLKRIEAYFKNPNELIPKDQISQYAVVHELLDGQKKGDNAFIGNVLRKMPFIKYGHSQATKLQEMNRILTSHAESSGDLKQWCDEWKNRQKYARTGAEWLPHLLEKLEAVEQYITTLSCVMDDSKTYPMREKTNDFIAMRNMLTFIKKEREAIHESMLLRLEMIEKHQPRTLLNILSEGIAEEKFYANILDDSYLKLVQVTKSRNRFASIDPVAEITGETIKHFMETICVNGTEDQKRRLQQINPDFVAVISSDHMESDLLGSYVNEASIDHGYEVNFADHDHFNLQYVVSNDYVSKPAFKADKEKMERLKAVMADTTADESRVVVVDEADYLDNKIDIFNRFESGPVNVENIYQDIWMMNKSDRLFFVKLFLGSFDLSENQRKLFMLVVGNEQSIILSVDEFNAFYLKTASLQLPDIFSDILDLYNASQELLDDESLVALLTLIELYAVLVCDETIDKELLDHSIKAISSIDDIIERVKEFDAIISNNDSSPHIVLNDEMHTNNDLRLPISASKPATFFEKHPWFKWALVGAAVAAVVAVAVFVSVASFGAVPAALGVGAAVGIAVGATLASSFIGGLIGVGIKYLKDKFKKSKATGKSESTPLLTSTESMHEILGVTSTTSKIVPKEDKQAAIHIDMEAVVDVPEYIRYQGNNNNSPRL